MTVALRGTKSQQSLQVLKTPSYLPFEKLTNFKDIPWLKMLYTF